MDSLRQSRRCSTRELSDLFGVSEVTIRQDLTLLEEEGFIERVHGGAVLTPRLQSEETRDQREVLCLEEKQRIARAAAAYVQSGDTILLDSSTTAFQMTPFLAEKRDITVVTNQFHIARVLSGVPTVTVTMIGGTLRRETWSMIGPLAEHAASRVTAKLGFFGSAGVTLTRGLTDADPREVSIKRVMAAAAERIFVLVDSSKFGRSALLQTIPLNRVSQLITTAGAPAEMIDALTAREIVVQIVP